MKTLPLAMKMVKKRKKIFRPENGYNFLKYDGKTQSCKRVFLMDDTVIGATTCYPNSTEDDDRYGRD